MGNSIFLTIYKLTNGKKDCRINQDSISYGAAKVSTGILRHDKRGGPDNPVILSNLKLNDNNKVALAA